MVEASAWLHRPPTVGRRLAEKLSYVAIDVPIDVIVDVLIDVHIDVFKILLIFSKGQAGKVSYAPLFHFATCSARRPRSAPFGLVGGGKKGIHLPCFFPRISGIRPGFPAPSRRRSASPLQELLKGMCDLRGENRMAARARSERPPSRGRGRKKPRAARLGALPGPSLEP